MYPSGTIDETRTLLLLWYLLKSGAKEQIISFHLSIDLNDFKRVLVHRNEGHL